MSARAQKEAQSAFWACLDRTRFHVRVGQRRADGTKVWLVGCVWDLHGTVCTCCPRREAP